jgi:glycosyltransferase involved in cell wall biosynthesis
MRARYGLYYAARIGRRYGMTTSATTCGLGLSNVALPAHCHSGRARLHPGVWVVVPAYNEQERIAATLTELAAYADNVVVVDDGSRDETASIARAYATTVVSHRDNLGCGAALRTGIAVALARGASIVVTFDADGQHCPEDLHALVEPIARGRAEIALGSRFLGRAPGIPPSRWLLLKLGVLFTHAVSRIRVTDTHNGLRAFSRNAAAQLRITQDGMAHASEILHRIAVGRLAYTEVPVTIRYNEATLKKGQRTSGALTILFGLLRAKLGGATEPTLVS